MEYKEIYMVVFVLVIVGFLVGVGMYGLDKFSTASKDITTLTNETINCSLFGRQTKNITLANDEVTEIVEIRNNTQFSFVSGTDFKEVDYYRGQVELINASKWNTAVQHCNVTYKYRANSDASSAIDNTTTEIGNIPNLWLSLIVTIAVLAIILGMITKSFLAKR